MNNDKKLFEYDDKLDEENSFISNEIKDRENFNYYTDEKKYSLFRKEKETNKIEELLFKQDGKKLSPLWKVYEKDCLLEDYNKIEDFKEVINVILKILNELKYEYLIPTFTDYKAIDLEDSNYILNKGADLYKEDTYSKSIEYYRLAAAMGNIHAVSNLGYCYLYGRSINPNPKLAIAYFTIAAKKGDTDAAYKLGDIYSSDKWGEKDKELSIYYYRMAASYILGEEWDTQNGIAYCEELQSYPSLCFALGRETSKEGDMYTDLDKSYQFLLQAKYGYEIAIRNGNTMYEKVYNNLLEYINKDEYNNMRDKYDNLFAKIYNGLADEEDVD